MCGICGELLLGSTDKRVREEDIQRMLAAIRHRGPDHTQIWISPNHNIGLGHARLKIIDLSDKANQPMLNETQSILLICNGEIYNFQSLREGLIKNGHRFVSKSDNEVILHLFEEEGINSLRYLDGMFAFALWDIQNECIYLIRDRIGKKPLYYSFVNNKLIFASEVKALLCHPDVNKELDYESVYYYLTFAYTPAPYTMFKGIYKLPAANYLKINRLGTSLQQECYWKPKRTQIEIPRNEKEWIHVLRDSLHEAVRKRLIADVPVSIYLSGGVDSSLITAIASRVSINKINTFCIGYDSHYSTEDIKWAREISKIYNTRHHELIVSSKDAIDSLNSILEQYDDLTNDSSIPFYFLSKKAQSEGFKVVLIGEGSDEIFSGYRFLGTVYKYQRLLSSWEKFFSVFNKKPVKFLSRLASISNNYFTVEMLRSFEKGHELFWGMDVLFRYDKREKLFSKEFSDKIKNEVNPYDLIRSRFSEYKNEYNSDSILSKWFYLELANHLPECILSRVDKGSMQFSVEARAPYLDISLIELSMVMPDKLKIKKEECKYILKQIAKEYLPEALIYRKKIPLPVPYIGWLKNNILNFKEIFCDNAKDKSDIFNIDYLLRLYEMNQKGMTYYSDKLWAVYLFRRWFNKWFN